MDKTIAIGFALAQGGMILFCMGICVVDKIKKRRRDGECRVCGYKHDGDQTCYDVVKIETRKKWLVETVVLIIGAALLFWAWGRCHREPYYNEADCPPECVEVHR